MLKSLFIKNVALIESAEIIFENGLNVLSGETGAGKSVIIESLNFVLGAKADKSLIRSGETECLVKAEFDVSENNSVQGVLEDIDVEQDDLLIVSRKFNQDGKSTIKINGATVSVGMLKKLTEVLVDVHGQSEHFHLLKTSNQLKLLDEYAPEKIKDLFANLADLFVDYNKTIKELSELGGDDSQRLLKIDVLNYQINEIERVGVKDGEEEELISIRQKLLHQQKICQALACVNDVISQEFGISDNLSNSLRTLNGITEYSPEYSSLYERLYNAYAELDDIACEASSLLEAVETDNYNPDEIEERLESIKQLKKKYGSNFEEINAFYEKAKIEKEKLENFNELAQTLLIDKSNLEKKIYDLYNEISLLRKDTAKSLTKNVLSELKDLGMAKSQFNVDFAEIPNFDDCQFSSKNGIDKIEFMFSANLGEPIKPLSNVISGGEMSRFMLALKAQTAKLSETSTFIFDEIDAGISGFTAKVVAEKLAKISNKVQVIAISHLPQISAMADNNLLIEKVDDGERSITKIKKLTEEEKIKEISRLVSGNCDSKASIASAKELIEKSNEYKIKKTCNGVSLRDLN